MIVEFSVTNFASIKDRQVLSFVADNSSHLEEYYTIKAGDLRLLKMCLIFGANASGKTTILKAIDFLNVLVNREAKSKTSHISYQPFLLDERSREENSEFEITFFTNNKLYYYKVVFNRQCIVSEVLKDGPKGRIVCSRTTDLDRQLAKVKLGRSYHMEDALDLRLLNKNTLWNESFIQGYRRTNIDFAPLQDVSFWFDTYLKRILKPSQSLDSFVSRKLEDGTITSEELLPIIQKADLNISNFSIEKKTIPFDAEVSSIPSGASIEVHDSKNEEDRTITYRKVQFTHKDISGNENSSIPYSAESLGTQRYFGLAGLLCWMIKKSTCLCIDELESSLHPDLLKHFLLSFCVNVKRSQLIATTHFSSILNNKDLFRNDMIVFTEKDESMSTQVYKLSDFGTNVVRDTSNVFNAYAAGRLGAVPNLGDYYIGIENEG